MGSSMKFLALISEVDEGKGVIRASIFDPRALRGETITFPRAKLEREGEKWQPSYVPLTASLVGELGSDKRVTKVKLLPDQQFRGYVREWDPIHMRATVEYPELEEIHVHNLETPWLEKGDRIIVKGRYSGLEWSLGDFRMHRRVRSRELETGVISSLQGRYGTLTSMLGEALHFESRDVLLCDCRDFYPDNLGEEDYDPDLESTFRVRRRVFFIRTEGGDSGQGAIKVFVPRTEFGILDPIFEPAFNVGRQFIEGSENAPQNYMDQMSLRGVSGPNYLRG